MVAIWAKNTPFGTLHATFFADRYVLPISPVHVGRFIMHVARSYYYA